MAGLFSRILPNPAPEVDMAPPSVALPNAQNLEAQFEDPDEPRKKKYAKEAWPGKKATASFLV
jgi:nuclear inhibitor of protein phosphatase 1